MLDSKAARSAESRPSASIKRRTVAGSGARRAPGQRFHAGSGQPARPTPPARALPPVDAAAAALRRILIRLSLPYRSAREHTPGAKPNSDQTAIPSACTPRLACVLRRGMLDADLPAAKRTTDGHTHADSRAASNVRLPDNLIGKRIVRILAVAI